jgi:hypothetical protein
LWQIFQKIFEAKLKEGDFVDAQIKQLFNEYDYSTKLKATDRSDWEAFGNACRNFVDNEIEENCS